MAWIDSASFFQAQLLSFNEKSKGQLLSDRLYEEKTDSWRELIVLLALRTHGQIGFLFMEMFLISAWIVH